MFVQFGFKQPLPRMQFNEKLFVSLEFEDICLQNQNSTNRHFSKITWRINIIIPKYIDNRKKQECLLDTKRD